MQTDYYTATLGANPLIVGPQVNATLTNDKLYVGVGPSASILGTPLGFNLMGGRLAGSDHCNATVDKFVSGATVNMTIAMGFAMGVTGSGQGFQQGATEIGGGTRGISASASTSYDTSDPNWFWELLGDNSLWPKDVS
jgi:hypothetical protein